MQYPSMKKQLNAVRLSQEEQQHGEIKKQIFVLVRALDFIEKAYNQDKIEESVYE